MKQTYQFSIEIGGSNWRQSPEYPTQEECFGAALRCTKKLGKRYQRITFVTNMRYEEPEKKV